MLKHKQEAKKQSVNSALKVRSGLSAGGSVAACTKNLNYWKNAYIDRCGVLK